MSRTSRNLARLAGRSARRPGPLLFALALLLTLAAPGGAAVRRLTHDTVPDDQPRVNGAGQVIWVTASALYLWNGVSVQQLATYIDETFDHQISESGAVVWQGYASGSSQLLLWDGSAVRQLFSGQYGDFHPRFNAAGQVVWQASDGKVVQLFLWEGRSVRQLTHGSQDSVNPQINRAGQIVWESHEHIYQWDGETTRELTRSPQFLGRARHPQINNLGQVVWEGSDDGSGDFTFWDGEAPRPIKTPDGFANQLHLSDAGTVAFAGFDNGAEPLYVWNGASIFRLAAHFGGFLTNAAGEVAWATDQAVFLWDGTGVRQLAASSSSYAGIGLSDAGQVVWQVPIPSGENGFTDIARWDGTRTEIISDAPEEHDPEVGDKHGLMMGPSGDVVWVGYVLGSSAEIFLYTPPAPGSLKLALPVVPGGRPTTGRVTLPEPAPAGGAVVHLASANPAVAAVPLSVTVPAGMTLATFPVTTFPVRPSTTVTLSASYGGHTWMATLEVDQVGIDLPGGITQLTSGYSGNASPRLNDAGQVVWLSTSPARAPQILLWTGGPVPAILPLAAGYMDPPTRLSGRGEVLWEAVLGSGLGRGLFLWDGRTAQQIAWLGPDFGPGPEQINDRGQIVWQHLDTAVPPAQNEATLWFWDGETRRLLAGLGAGGFRTSRSILNNRGHVVGAAQVGQTAQLFIEDGLARRQITHGPDSYQPIQINDRDQVLEWDTDPAGQTWLALWDNSAEHRIAPQPGGYYIPPILNNQGWVLWEDNGKLNLWNGSTIQQINRSVGFPGYFGPPGYYAGLNDAGEVTWRAVVGSVEQIFLWHDGIVRTLTQDEAYSQDLQLNNAGQVVWTNGSPAQVYLYTPPLALTVSPTPLIGGQPATGTVTLAAPAPAGGVVVQLASQSPAVTVPPGVTIPAGQISAPFPITTSPAGAPAPVILTAATADAYRPAVVPLLPEGLSLQPDRVQGGEPATGTIVLPQAAPAGGAVVQIESDAAAAQAPAAVTVPAGESVATFPVVTSPLSANTAAHLAASSNGARWTATLAVLSPPVSTLAVDSATVSGGLAATGTVTLTGPAPASGVVVQLVSDNPALASVPATVTVPEGATQTRFSISTPAVGQESTVSIAASAGDTTLAAVLEVVPVHLVSVQVTPGPVVGSGAPTPQVTITLSGPAPPEGAAIQLSSDHPELVSFGDSYLVHDSSSLSVPLSVSGVSAPADVVITARYGGASISATLNLLPASVGSLVLLPDHVPGGLAVRATVTLNSLAPSGGTIVRLSSDHPEIASVPAQVTIPNTAAALAFFPVPTRRPAQDTVVQITAMAGGQSRSAALTVYAVSVASLTLSPPIVLGGTPVSGRVTLNVPAPAGGAVVSLVRRGSGATAPDQVTVPAGAMEATFPVTTQAVSFPTSFSLEADFGGATRYALLQVVPLAVVSLALQPAEVTGGESVTGTVILNFPAGPDGATVTLVSSAPKAASAPAAVMVPAGAVSASFPVSTHPVAADTEVVVRATLGRTTVPAMLRVRAPLLDRVTLEPAILPGGGVVVGRIDLTGAAAARGARATLASGDPNAASVPAFVDLPPGASEAVFAIATQPVAAAVAVPIEAAAGGVNRSAVLTVLPAPAPPATFAVSVLPGEVRGGNAALGAIALASPAPPGGRVFTLTTDHADLVTLPDQVVVPAGASAVTFPVQTRVVTAPTPVSIAAKTGNEEESTVLKLLP